MATDMKASSYLDMKGAKMIFSGSRKGFEGNHGG